MRVGLTYNLAPNIAECLAEVVEIATSLERLGNEVVKVGSAQELVDKLAAGQRWDIIFNCCRSAENASSEVQIPTLLDIYDVPCCFSNAATLTLCGQRNLLKSLLRDRGVPTSDYWLVETLNDIARVDATWPATVSPTSRCCPSAIISVKDASELSKACCHVMGSAATPALIEPELSDEMIIVAMLGDGESASAMLPVNIPTKRSSASERLAKAAWRTVGGCDAGCVCLQIDRDGQPHVVNIEPLPSFAPDSSFRELTRTAGLELDDVIGRVLQSASQRARVATRLKPPRPHMASAFTVAPAN